MLDVHTHFNPLGLLDISENYFSAETSAFFSVGIHPKAGKNADFNIVKTLALRENCLAIGECGLDKFSSLSLEEQKDVFVSQVRLAKTLKKPLIIHCVRLYNEVLRVLKEEKFLFPVIFHGFNGNSQTTNQLLKFSNVYFSLSERLLKGNNSVLKSLPIIPLDRIFLESDTDGNTDFLRLINTVAELKGVENKIVKTFVEQNFMKVFF